MLIEHCHQLTRLDRTIIVRIDLLENYCQSLAILLIDRRER